MRCLYQQQCFCMLCSLCLCCLPGSKSNSDILPSTYGAGISAAMRARLNTRTQALQGCRGGRSPKEDTLVPPTTRVLPNTSHQEGPRQTCKLPAPEKATA